MEDKNTSFGKILESLNNLPNNLSSFIDNQPKLPDYSSLLSYNMPVLEPIENPMIEQLQAIIEELKKANERQEIELKNRATELEDSKRALEKQTHDNKIMLWCTVISTTVAIVALAFTVF